MKPDILAFLAQNFSKRETSPYNDQTEVENTIEKLKDATTYDIANHDNDNNQVNDEVVVDYMRNNYDTNTEEIEEEFEVEDLFANNVENQEADGLSSDINGEQALEGFVSSI